MSLSTINSKSDKRSLIPANLKRYIAIYLLGLLIMFSVVGAINALIDPHGRLLLVDRPGFNAIKVTLKEGSRKAKSIVFRQCGYDIIIFGTSRAESGILTKHPALKGKRSYNAAMKAASMYEIRRLIEYALEQQNPDMVIIGLDLYSFHHLATTFDDFEESVLAENMQTRSMLKYLLSMQNLYESWVTFNWNFKDIAKNCFQTGEYQWQSDTNNVAPRKTFDFMLKRYASGIYNDFDIGEQHYTNLEIALEKLDAAGVQVYAFLTPMHATHIELIREMAILDKYHSWKRRLADIFTKAGEHAVLWDFTGYNRITTEPVPAEGSGLAMRWYSDSSHFKSVVGAEALNRMLGLRSSPDLQLESFGTPLTPSNVDSVITQEDAGSLRYREQHPEELERMREMLKYAPYPQFIGL